MKHIPAIKLLLILLLGLLTGANYNTAADTLSIMPNPKVEHISIFFWFEKQTVDKNKYSAVNLEQVKEDVELYKKLYPAIAADIYIINEVFKNKSTGMFINGSMIPGTKSIYLFMQPRHDNKDSDISNANYSNTLAHEIGHIVWFNILAKKERTSYIQLRGLYGKNQQDIEEIFAEDFRLLFGSNLARIYPHSELSTYPGEDIEKLIKDSLSSNF